MQLIKVDIPEQVILDLDKFAPYRIGTWLHHIRRYEFAANFLRTTDAVLDVCCGSGYGSHIMKSVAQKVTGVDRNKTAINFAKAKYPECEFVEHNVLVYQYSNSYNLYSNSYNVITMFESLDHLDKISGIKLIKALANICQDMMFLSLPQDQKLGINPYHLAEWSDTELKELLEQHFRRVVLFGQSWVSGQIYFPYEERRSITVFWASK